MKELELYILIDIILNNNLAIKTLKEEDFNSCRDIYKKIAKLYNENQVINLFTVCEDNTNWLEALSFALDHKMFSRTLEDNIKLLRHNNEFKKINKLKEYILNIKDKDLKKIKKEIINIVNNINIETKKENDTIELAQTKFLTELEERKKYNKNTDLYTGFFKLDDILSGFHAGELTCIGARPGSGKTAFALDIARKIAYQKNVYFISLEMSTTQLMNRLNANLCEINSKNISNGSIEDDELLKIANKTDEILKLKLTIDTKVRYIEDIELICKNTKIDILFIDYLTLLKIKEKFHSRELEVAEISRKLKLLSLELNIPIIILVQLNRDAENREPNMANIRESGTIEQNCDNIIFLHNDNKQEKSAEEINIIVAKQRNGEIGKIKLKFIKKYSKFQNIIYGD